jgi:DNA invertase Pin-like site-specific DNA recombinase
MKTIGYTRVSTREQAETGCSLQAQRDKIHAYALLHDLGEVEIIEDAGCTGKDLGRGGARRLIGLCEDRQVAHVIVYKLDRLTRRTRDLLYLVDDVFSANGVAFHSLSESIDTGTAMGTFFLTLMGALAQMQRDLIAERTRDVLHAKKDRGEVVGTVPFGFMRDGDDLLPVPEELQVIVRMRRWQEAGLSLREIARRLNDREVPTKRGGMWHARTVAYMLKNDLYATAEEAP